MTATKSKKAAKSPRAKKLSEKSLTKAAALASLDVDGLRSFARRQKSEADDLVARLHAEDRSTPEIFSAVRQQLRRGQAAYTQRTAFNAGATVALAHVLDAWAARTEPLRPTEYEQWFRETYLPAFNAANRRVRLCEKCLASFAVLDGHAARARFCSEKCGNAHRHQNVNTKAATSERVRRHWAKCKRCKLGEHCMTSTNMEERAAKKYYEGLGIT